jgi:hypothetical protein
MADNLPPSSADVTESGSHNLPQPSGPHRPIMGLLYLYIYLYLYYKNVWSIYQNDKDTLHKNKSTFMVISRSVLLRMRNVSDKSCRENQNTHFVLNKIFQKIVPFMRYVGKFGTAGQVTYGNTIRRTRFVCWVTEVTNTNSFYLILTVFPRRHF